MNLVERFDSITLDDLSEFVREEQEENLSLDFKVVNKADLSHSDDKKNLAKALSGFANSSGGLVVWGIDARKNSRGVDCASGIKEIEAVQLFISRLNALTGEAVSPVVDGILHRSIPTISDKGLVLTLVPESDSGPHMAKLGEDRYFKRSGDSFYRMEHFDLEDMFGRRKKPKLSLSMKIFGRRAHTKIILGIKNEGRATAKAPYLAFNHITPFYPSEYGVDGNGNHGLPRLPAPPEGLRSYRFGANSNFVIHPGTTLDITQLIMGLSPRDELFPGGELVIEYEIASEDTQIIEEKAVINLDSYS